MIKTGSLLFISLFISAAAFAADPSGAKAVPAGLHFDATVDRNEITQNDNVTLTLTLSSDGNISGEEEPRLPALDGFELLNKWSQSESSSVFDNGQFKFQRKIIYRYSLSPQKAGTILIGPAEVRVGGQTLRSQPIKISVAVAGSQSPNSKIAKNTPQDDSQMGPFGDDDESDLFSQLLRRRGLGPQGQQGPPSMGAPQDVNTKDIFFLGVEVNKKKAYVGEEVIATWYLYTRGNLQGFDALKYPELKGFWKEELDMATRLSFHQDVVNGIPYNKALLVSYALFPISPGKKVIDSYQAKGTVIQLDSPMAMFGLGQPTNITKSSKEIPLDVVPLPTVGQPPSFSGAVGRFSVTGSLSATQVKANQPVSLKIRFTGEGNVKAIELPPIDLPKNLELYDTKKESKFQKSGDGYKEFELLIVPRSEGDVTIPPIAVSYFDPKAEKYVTTQTPTFSLKVLPGDPASASNLVSPTKLEPESAKVVSAPDIKYLKTSSEFALQPQEEKLLWIIAFLALYLSFGFQIWRAFVGSDTNSTSEIKKRVKKKLQTARVLLKKQDWRGVGVECSNAVISTLGEVTGGGGATPSEILLSRLPAENSKLQDTIRKFLSQCEIISFAPKEMAHTGRTDGEVKKLISDAEKIIEKLLQVSKIERNPQPRHRL